MDIFKRLLNSSDINEFIDSFSSETMDNNILPKNWTGAKVIRFA